MIEVLMIVFIMGIVFVVGSNLFLSILKGSNKAEVEKEVKQNGDYALGVMQRMIRNAQGIQSCTAQSIGIINSDQGITTFSCVLEDSVTKIASGSGRLTGKNVTLGATCPATIFSCNLTKSPPVVEIRFTLLQAGTSTRVEERAQANFQTTVSLRTY